MRPAQRDSVFVNVPYDLDYKDHFLAYIAGVAAFGLNARATLELTGGERRLDRIFQLILEFRYSFHDLSLVKLDSRRPRTPRFNMPFELGLVVGWKSAKPSAEHDWFVFESSPHRLQKSLSDLNGTDPFVYGASPEGILQQIRNALSRRDVQPTAQQMLNIYGALRDAKPEVVKGVSSPFEAAPFRELVYFAREFAEALVPGLENS
jgi:hypothetical protein